MSEHHIAEEQFYSRYAWCLNPILSIEELLNHLNDEVHSSSSLTGWHKEESVINIYLFVCAIACTLDDYAARRILNLAPLRNRLPKLGLMIAALERIVLAIEWIRRLTDYKIRRFRKVWNDCVEHACNMLIEDSTDLNSHLEKLRVALEYLSLIHI